MTDTAPSHAAILADLIQGRGGDSCFTVETRAVASAVASLLADVADGDASGIGSLPAMLALLPPRQAPSPPADLTRLTGGEIADLDRLMSKACGVEPPESPVPDEPPEPSAREEAALELAHLCDKAAQRDKQLSENELIAVRGAILDLVYGLTLPVRLWECYIGRGGYADDRPVVAAPAEPEPVKTEPEPAKLEPPSTNGNGRHWTDILMVRRTRPSSTRPIRAARSGECRERRPP